MDPVLNRLFTVILDEKVQRATSDPKLDDNKKVEHTTTAVKQTLDAFAIKPNNETLGTIIATASNYLTQAQSARFITNLAKEYGLSDKELKQLVLSRFSELLDGASSKLVDGPTSTRAAHKRQIELVGLYNGEFFVVDIPREPYDASVHKGMPRLLLGHPDRGWKSFEGHINAENMMKFENGAALPRIPQYRDTSQDKIDSDSKITIFGRETFRFFQEAAEVTPSSRAALTLPDLTPELVEIIRNTISNELGGAKFTMIEWDPDPKTLYGAKIEDNSLPVLLKFPSKGTMTRKPIAPQDVILTITRNADDLSHPFLVKAFRVENNEIKEIRCTVTPDGKTVLE